MYFMYLLYIRRVGPVTGMVQTTGPGLFDVAMKPKAGCCFHPPACAKKNVSVCSGLTLVALQYSFINDVCMCLNVFVFFFFSPVLEVCTGF